MGNIVHVSVLPANQKKKKKDNRNSLFDNRINDRKFQNP